MRVLAAESRGGGGASHIEFLVSCVEGLVQTGLLLPADLGVSEHLRELSGRHGLPSLIRMRPILLLVLNVTRYVVSTAPPAYSQYARRPGLERSVPRIELVLRPSPLRRLYYRMRDCP
jgi:hypothetical protein